MTQQLLSIVNEAQAQAAAATAWGLDGKPAAKGKAKPADKAKSPTKAKPKAAAKPATKTVSKPAAKGATTRKAASKPAEKPATGKKVVEAVKLAVRIADRTKAMYTIQEDARPTRGVPLFAHTHAVLTVLGLYDAARPSVSKRALVTIMGQRAVSYHSKLGTIESAPPQGDMQRVRLSLLGWNKFSARVQDGQIDAKQANAFMDLFIDGKTEGTGVKAGNVFQTGVGL